MIRIFEILARTIPIAAVIAFLVSPDPVEAQPSRGLARFKTEALVIEAASGRHKFSVEVARSARQQAQGLMYRRRLAAGAGMLFVHREVRPVAMWMKNTFIPLDMLFIAADGRIVRIVERTVPHSTETISSGGPVRAVLELNAGTVRRLKLRPGDRVSAPSLRR